MMKCACILTIILRILPPIIIYEDKDELMSTVKLNGDTPPLGVYYSGTLNLLSPNLWIKGYDIEQEYKNTTPCDT